MRCLYCGNPLSVLQKVKDSDFCSAEHRSHFLGEQQRLMADRLKRAAARIKVKPAAPKPAPAVEAPAPPAPFVLKHPDAQNCFTALMSVGPFDGVTLAIAPPPLVVAAFTADSLLPGLVPDLPWPRYNPGLWSFGLFLPEYGGEQLAALADVLGAWSPLRSANFVRYAGLVHLRRPDIVAPPRRTMGQVATWLSNEAATVFGMERLRTVYGRRSNVLPLVALAGDQVPAVIVPSDGTVLICAEPVDADPTALLPEIAARQGGQRLTAIERIFRMRPRGAVGQPVAIPLAIEPHPLGAEALMCGGAAGATAPLDCALRVSQRASMPVRPADCGDTAGLSAAEAAAFPSTPRSPQAPHGSSSLEPPQVERAFRMRPRSGVADSRLADLAGSGIEPMEVRLRPDGPHAGVCDCAPAVTARFFRPRSAGPVDDTAIEAQESVLAEAAAFATAPSVPSPAAAAGTLEPQPAERAFRVRQRTGVLDSGMADLASAGVVAESVSLPPESPHADIPDCAPRLLPRFFRARARGPLDANTPASLSTPAVTANSTPLPCVPGISPNAGTPEPVGLERPVRMRPRSGVADARLPGLAASGLEPQTVKLRPQSPHVEVGECAPRLLPRFFRARPAGGVIDSNLATAEALRSEQTAFGSNAAIPTAPAEPATLAPRASERAFRMRPQSGVADSRMADLSGCGVDVHPATPPPLTPHVGFGDCAPTPVARFFRPRPRGPVADPVSMAVTGAAEEAVFSALPIERGSTVVGELECAPAVVTRFFRPRPRGPVEDPMLPTAGTSVVDAGPFTASPAERGTLPAGELECAPARVARFFRQRPLAPLADSRLLDFEAIRAEWNASFDTAALPAGCTTPSHRFEPRACSKLYRMRPQGAAGTVAQPLIRADAVPFHAPPAFPALSDPSWRLELGSVSRAFRMRPRTALDCLVACGRLDPHAAAFPAAPAALAMDVNQCAPVEMERLFRAHPTMGVRSQLAFTQIHTADVQLPSEPAYATFGSGALGVLSPDFLNRLYRVRPRTPLEDESTQAKEIRCRQVPVAEPDPVIASMPGAEKQRGLSFINRLYKFRPRGARESAPEPKPIACEAVAGAGAEAGPSGMAQPQNDILHAISRHWKILPLDLKAMALLIPIVFIIAFQPGAPKEGSVAAAGVRVEAPAQVQSAVGTRVSGVERGIRARAAVDLREDFQSGLHRWNGKDGWGSSWKYHTSGAIMPGTLALFQPSLTLSDYKLEFSAQIVDKGFGWAFRALNDKNYYGIRLITESAGPLPKLFLERWAVVDGVELDRVRIPLPITVARDTLYRIALEVRDQYFTLMIQGQVVDFWSDAKLKAGGIGFFTAKGEQALIQALRITHQYDLVGRVVAAFFGR